MGTGSKRRAAKRTILVVIISLLTMAAGTAQTSPSPRLFTFTHPAMATIYTLYLYSSDAQKAAEQSEEAFDEIDRIEQLLSNYRESSELSRINHSAADGPVTIDPEMLDFLQQSVHWSQVSDGAFDITVGKLMKVWGFYRHQGKVPSPEELQPLRAETGWQRIELDPTNRTVQFNSHGVELDPGGIGKGFAVDAAIRILRDDGVHAALLSAGGSTLFALGAPPGKRGWPVTVRGPLPAKHTLSVMYLRDESLSSADCTQKNFVANGHLYCHIMDPRTLRPVEGRIQVSIVHASATASDALSNVLFVEPPSESLRILSTAAPEARALIVSTGTSLASCTAFRWDRPIDPTHCTVSRTPATRPTHRSPQ